MPSKHIIISIHLLLTVQSITIAPKSHIETAVEWIRTTIGMQPRPQPQEPAQTTISQQPRINHPRETPMRTTPLRTLDKKIQTLYAAILQNESIDPFIESSQPYPEMLSPVRYAILLGRIPQAIRLAQANYPITEHDCHLAETLDPNNKYLADLYHIANEKSDHLILPLRQKSNQQRMLHGNKHAAVTAEPTGDDLLRAAQEGNQAAIINLVEKKGLNINSKNTSGLDILELATSKYDPAIFALAVDLGAQITPRHTEFVLLRREAVRFTSIDPPFKEQNLQSLQAIMNIIADHSDPAIPQETAYVIALLRSNTACKTPEHVAALERAQREAQNTVTIARGRTKEEMENISRL